MTEDTVYRLEAGGSKELKALVNWQNELSQNEGFNPVIIGGAVEAPDPLNPEKTNHGRQHRDRDDPRRSVAAPRRDHRAGGRRRPQRQGLPQQLPRPRGVPPRRRPPRLAVRPADRRHLLHQPLVCHGRIDPQDDRADRLRGRGRQLLWPERQDLSGQAFRHGERVAEGERGVLEKPLGPGKYAFNTYAGNIVLVPTTNFVLHWVTGRTEAHRYDESLRSIDLVTKDAYEPTLPLSVVVHIDYQKAPNVIQRFGDVKKLITQTLDPMLSAYFRDVAHKRTMLELLQDRDSIQHESSSELGRKFHNFDIECVDVLIGKPDTAEAGGKIETLLEQLRLRQLSLEQVETYAKQVTAAEKLRVLNEAQARPQMQTNCRTRWSRSEIAENEAEAQLARARKQAEQVVVTAQAESQSADPRRPR